MGVIIMMSKRLAKKQGLEAQIRIHYLGRVLRGELKRNNIS